ncbi:hypothetical protein [Streptomyces roseoviridis]|uniref:Uncharacterized protein n=1 Tax=Streptomyces roseoviridis TaxID=67361 RepID=A0ABV5QTS3_9ACTN
MTSLPGTHRSGRLAPHPRIPRSENTSLTSHTPLDGPPPAAGDEPDARFPYGNLLFALTARVNTSTDEREVAAVLHQVLDGNDGLLTRLAELFDAAAEKARAHDRNDGDDDAFHLAKDLAEAAARLRRLGEDLHVVPERMVDLAPASPQQPWQPVHPGVLPGLPTALPAPMPGRAP